MGAVLAGIVITGAGIGAGLLPIVLFHFNFYTDSICHKPVQMLGAIEPDRGENQDEQQLCIGNRTAHGKKYPYIEEFSELIQDLSMRELEDLMTNQQKALGKAIWEAENYGGCTEKAKKRLSETHGPHWFKTVRFKDHFAVIRDYYELVLILEHQRQWDEYKKVAKLNQENSLS